ncbi:hypothetical protein GCM10011374_37910 [Kocuria dechangensis]|uniref:Uncharacterized protein n=1 Tax=Kocuria dechangensis TaxID=1176249 RepID=A0A917H6Z6_9MICC|nr:hypothetical protein GCM10011374_37910 [Kocuria dechangensis]
MNDVFMLTRAGGTAVTPLPPPPFNGNHWELTARSDVTDLNTFSGCRGRPGNLPATLRPHH